MDPDARPAKLSLPIFKELLKNSGRLTAMVWREKKRQMILLGVIYLIVSAAPFLQSGSRGLLVNELVGIAGSGSISAYVAILVALMIAAGLIPSLLYLVQNYYAKIFWFYLEEKFEILQLQKRAEIDVAVHEDPAKNDLLNMVQENGSWRVRNFIDRQYYILQNLAEVAIATAVIFFVSWWAFALILVGALPQLLLEVRYGRQVWGIHSAKAEVRRRFWDLGGHFRNLNTLIELKLFQNTFYFLKTIRELFRSFQDEQRINERRRLTYETLTLSFSQLTIALAMVWFVWRVIDGDIQIGTFTFIVASVTELRQSLSSLFVNLGVQYQDSLFVSNIFRFLDIKPVVKLPARGIKLDPNVTPEIVFEKVTFAYPGSSKPVLKDFSLKIEPGDKLAIVGINGAGKTTFVKLLCRFYDPTAGRILVAGHDLREIDLESWYQQLGIIFQDYAHYHFLVRDAIAVGRLGEESTLEKVQRAAEASEADVFIGEWEKNYDQMLGKEFTGGVEPSIGQWQKLALARTFYRQPRVLVLDEPTSSIDAEAEAKIFEKLEKLPSDRTVILISHRFSTVRRAGKIAVIEAGRLKEFGSHVELLELKGIYARLFAIQAKGYK
jgi:ABC-type multidrug transport system fused ATPase/permease subunit